jgi:ABC-type lipoprotein export system ATPase subunit
MNKNKFLKLVDVKKSFIEGSQKIDVLKGIDLQCYHGKWYTIYGVSGSGKTTLLNILGGLEKPDSGRFLYEDIDVYNMPDYRLSNWRNSNIGFVFQFFYLISELNVEENILLPLNVSGLKPDREWLKKIVNVLDIGKLLARNPATLSGGEKQRVAMARAIINRPDFIVADEPTGNLDSGNSRMVINLLRELKEKSNIGIILATHEKDLANIGEYNLHLKDGLLEFKGD